MTGARHADRLLRHAVQGGEVTLAHLLPPARGIEHDAFRGDGSIEVGDMRIVKGEVAVFADADEREVDRRGQQPAAVTAHHFIEVRGIALDAADRARMHALHKVVLDPIAETGGVPGGNPDVFVQLEGVDPVPIDVRQPREHADHFQLGIAGADHDACLATAASPFTLKTGLDLRRMDRDIRDHNRSRYNFVGPDGSNAATSTDDFAGPYNLVDEGFYRGGRTEYGEPWLQYPDNYKLYDLFVAHPEYGFFPSANVVFNLTQNLLLRASYAKTINRPNLDQIIPG